MEVKQIHNLDCAKSSKQLLYVPNMVGYKFLTILHRNGHRYAIDECQYVVNDLYFRLLAPEDTSIPFEDIFKDGNGIFVGRGDPTSSTLLVQNANIVSIEVQFTSKIKAIAKL